MRAHDGERRETFFGGMRSKRQETREGGGGKETNGWVGLSLASLWPAGKNEVRSHTCLVNQAEEELGRKKDGRASRPLITTCRQMELNNYTNNFSRFLFLEIHPHFLLILDEVSGDR